MYIFVKENISFHSLIDISLQILLIPFLEDTLSFLYNVNKGISSVFSVKYTGFCHQLYKFWKIFGFANHDIF